MKNKLNIKLTITTLAIGLSAVLALSVLLRNNIGAKIPKQSPTIAPTPSSSAIGKHVDLTIGGGNKTQGFELYLMTKSDKYGGTKVSDATYRVMLPGELRADYEERKAFEAGSKYDDDYINNFSYFISNYCPAYPHPKQWLTPFKSEQPTHYVADDTSGYFLIGDSRGVDLGGSLAIKDDPATGLKIGDSVWQIINSPDGFNGTYHVHYPLDRGGDPGTPTNEYNGFSAKWTMPVDTGDYDLYVTWTPAPDLHAVFFEYNPEKPILLSGTGITYMEYRHALEVNQTQPPKGPTWDGRVWQKVGLFPVEVGSDGRAEIYMAGYGNEKFVADAIRLVPVPE